MTYFLNINTKIQQYYIEGCNLIDFLLCGGIYRRRRSAGLRQKYKKVAHMALKATNKGLLPYGKVLVIVIGCFATPLRVELFILALNDQVS